MLLCGILFLYPWPICTSYCRATERGEYDNNVFKVWQKKVIERNGSCIALPLAGHLVIKESE